MTLDLLFKFSSATIVRHVSVGTHKSSVTFNIPAVVEVDTLWVSQIYLTVVRVWHLSD